MARPQPRYHLHNKTQQKGWGSWYWQKLEVLGEEAASAWWLGEVPGRRCVATALLLDSGSSDVASPPGKRRMQHCQGWTLFLGSLKIQVAYSWCMLATRPAFRGRSIRFALVPKFIWNRSLNCYKSRLNLNFSAEHWIPGKFPQEQSFWMDLKIQHACGLTTSRLKGSGFGFLQSDPHCALHCSTAAVIPTRSGSVEAVMAAHFLRCQLEEKKCVCTVDLPAVMVGRGNMLGLFVRDTIWFMVYLN